MFVTIGNSGTCSANRVELRTEGTIRIIDYVSFQATYHLQHLSSDISKFQLLYVKLSTQISILERIVAESACLKEDTTNRIVIKVDIAEIEDSCFSCNQCRHSFGVISSITVCIACRLSNYYTVNNLRRLFGEVSDIELKSTVVVFSNCEVIKYDVSNLFS